jgi:hypothetical protein
LRGGVLRGSRTAYCRRMTDWTGAGRTTAELYLRMAELELHGVSTSYEALCHAVSGSEAVCALLERLPAGKRQPNLLLGAVRFLGGPVDDPATFLSFVSSGWDAVADTMMTHRTQTNEPGRCATLLPLLASLPQPLALVEVGASAGLCLYPDRYSYRYATSLGEHRLGDSEIVLSCAVTGPAPLPERLPEVVWRAGLDLNPLQASRADDRRWLASLIWPEQVDRAERLDRALDVVAADPPRLDTGDLLTDLPGLLADAPPDATVVVFHSAVLAYLDKEQRSRFTDVMQGLKRTREVHWVSNEAPGVIGGADLDPRPRGRFILAHDSRPVAVAGPHGHSLDWLPAPAQVRSEGSPATHGTSTP